LVVIALVAILATGTAFADHPDKFGIGVEGGYGSFWTDFKGPAGGNMNSAVSLKFKSLPIFWAIGMNIAAGGSGGNAGIGIMVSGDYYFMDMAIVGDMLHWYFGAGAQVNLGFGIDITGGTGGIDLDLLARVPVGISFQFPVSKIVLEAYMQAVPTIGVKVSPKFRSLVGVGGSFGFRVWF
ncbi:MAG: hypothetical protein FWC22_07600, partial [Treponema sp.]|nr:hypothetical protein [Treponema sp.]